ncbi:MAG: DUF1513 domain-containing protein, partial [Pseudomonadota bacterium]
MLTRRKFVAAAASATSALVAGCSRPSQTTGLLTAADDKAGESHAVLLTTEGTVRFATRLAERGHDVFATADGKSILAVARRPGRTLARISAQTGRILTEIETAPGRHLYGHAVVTQDGQYVLTSENNIADGQGVIVVRDGRTLSPLREFSSHGIGPHEIKWGLSEKTLVIANGGIATNPDYGRTPLNVDSMAPSLVHIRVRDGRLLGRVTPSHSKSSVRHIDTLENGTVIVGMQQQDGAAGHEPLVASTDWLSSRDLQPLDVTPQDLLSLQDYTASVCCDPVSGHTVITSPVGHRVTFWHALQQRFVGSMRLSDVAGVAFDRLQREF